MKIEFESHREKADFIDALKKGDREAIRMMYNRASKRVNNRSWEDWLDLDNAYVEGGRADSGRRG